jgi:SAM-dependent methyltransferase
MISLKSNLRRLKSSVFVMRGRRPYARGYDSYRRIQLEEYLYRELVNCALPRDWGLWLDERAVEYPWFFSRLPHTPGNLLDAGSVLNHDYVLSQEKLRNKTLSIFTLAPESENYCDRGISYVYGDLRECCYRDDYFDWIVSISTLEHVGMNNTLFYSSDHSKDECDPESHLQALSELRRVLKRGGVLYLTLPFGHAQIRGWLQIFDAEMVRKVLDVFRPASSREVYFRYTNSGWQVSSPDECRDARYFDPSNAGTIKTDFAAAEAVVCLELVK